MLKTHPSVLITGAVSLLGKHLINELNSDYTLYTTTHRFPLPPDSAKFVKQNFVYELTDTQNLEKLLQKTQPEVLIHLAGLSNIDYCESHPKEAWNINVGITKKLCQLLKGINTHIIFPSSIALFSGREGLYTEDEIPEPLNQYGKNKMEAEQLIKESISCFTILRSTTLFGWPPEYARDNDVTHYLKRLKGKDPIHLVNDRFYRPLYALRAAQSIKKIIEQSSIGIFNIAGDNQETRYSFVKKIADVFNINLHPSLIPVPSSYFPHLAPRPIKACLDNKKMKRVLGIIPQDILKELLEMKESVPQDYKYLIG